MRFFWLRLNTGTRSSYFGTIFTQANPNTVYGSIFRNNMDDSSFNDWDESLIKTITLPTQAFAGYQYHVTSNVATPCRVSKPLISFHTVQLSLFNFISNTRVV